jgi:hypothetical protein
MILAGSFRFCCAAVNRSVAEKTSSFAEFAAEGGATERRSSHRADDEQAKAFRVIA